MYTRCTHGRCTRLCVYRTVPLEVATGTKFSRRVHTGRSTAVLYHCEIANSATWLLYRSASIALLYVKLCLGDTAQKCNTCRVLETQSRRIFCFTIVQYVLRTEISGYSRTKFSTAVTQLSGRQESRGQEGASTAQQ